MIDSLFVEKFPYLSEYFELLLENKKQKVPNSIVLYGNSILNEYFFALEIARLLNCKGDINNFDCDCLNCKWIRSNCHPHVVSVSKLDFKPNSDTTKSVISVKQTEYLKDFLFKSCENYRVIILTDANIKKPSEEEKKSIEYFWKYSLLKSSENGDKIWIPSNIKREIFKEESANSLLKLIEEPYSKVIFIFLTKDKNDLIETIVSRSQCFYVPSFYDKSKKEIGIESISELLKRYPKFDIGDMIRIKAEIKEIKERNNLGYEEVIDSIFRFLRIKFEKNLDDIVLKDRIITDLKMLNRSKKYLKNYIKEENVIDDIVYNLLD